MAAIFAFKCTRCDELHEGSPSFGFRMPGPYAALSAEERATLGECTDDLCTLTRDGHTDYFVRGVLEVPIHGVEEPFLWGVWVSLSETSYRRYVDTLDEPVEGDGFFGWVCNDIPGYPFDGSRASDVEVQTDGSRPRIRLHQTDPEADALQRDQRDGLSVQRAQAIAESVMHGLAARGKR